MKNAVVIGGIAVASAAFLPVAWRHFEVWAVGIHQKSTTRELAAWEHEFSLIRNNEEAIRAVDMLRYIREYYVPGPGYRSDSETEAALNAQRQKTTITIAGALEAFTGELHGLNIDKWEAWRDGLRRQ